MDRVVAETNPYRGGYSESLPKVQFGFDALGRRIAATQADGVSTAHTDYSHFPCVLSTDEAGKSRTSCSDALGRLVSVTEDAGGANYFTAYSYTAAGDLVGVNQSGLTRSFAYDGLSRLITARNPETGTICYGQWVSGVCQGGYDDNGNLLHKIDANGTVLNYTYDALNRLTYVQTPGPDYTDVANTYDRDPNGIGRLSESDSLIHNIGPVGSRFTYDAMGRVLTADHLSYAPFGWWPGMAVQYDLAGNATQLTYPHGRQVSQVWDSAGRLAAVADGPSGSPGVPYLSGVLYSPSGAMTAATLGNHVTESLVQNSRLQPCRLMASTPLLAANPTGGNVLDRQAFYNPAAISPCGSEGNNNGNIFHIVDYRQPARTQDFSYDALNRLKSGSSQDGHYSHNYNYDAFGNMLLHDNLFTSLNYSIEAATNRLLLNGTDLQYAPGGQLVSSPNPLGGTRSFWYTALGQLRCIDGCATGSYLYNGLGERTFAGTSVGWHDYTYLNGQPMADLDNTGKWTDYIYANGQKIAKVDSKKPLWHMHFDRTSVPHPEWGVEGPVYGTPSELSGLLLVAGDKLALDIKQVGVPSYGGLALIFTDNTGAGDLTDEKDGTPLWVNGVADGQWHHLTASLAGYTGRTVAYAYAGLHNNMPAGINDIWIANCVILRADGSIVTIYNGQQNLTVGWSNTGAANFMYSGTDTVAAEPEVATTYFLDDHLGTTQMELSGEGWPVWQGQYAPFGQELESQNTTMRYKFTGKERDTESGLDYFGARYYASNMGRWMSPDWADKPEAVPYSSLDNPQSLNLYGYVLNNPLSKADADGHWPDCSWCSKAWSGVTGVVGGVLNVVPQTINAAGQLQNALMSPFTSYRVDMLPEIQADAHTSQTGLDVGNAAVTAYPLAAAVVEVQTTGMVIGEVRAATAGEAAAKLLYLTQFQPDQEHAHLPCSKGPSTRWEMLTVVLHAEQRIPAPKRVTG